MKLKTSSRNSPRVGHSLVLCTLLAMIAALPAVAEDRKPTWSGRAIALMDALRAHRVRAHPDGQGSLWVSSTPDTATGVSFLPRDINEHGQIAASIYNHDFTARQYLWDKGRLIDLGVLAGTGDPGIRNLINDRRQLATTRLCDLVQRTNQLVLWDKGTLTNLTACSASGRGYVFAMNNKGQVIGVDGNADNWFLDHGRQVLLDFFPVSLNDRGQVLGRIDYGDHTESILWQEGRTTRIFDNGSATGMNEHGQIIGFEGPFDEGLQGVVWDHGRITELGRNLVPSSINNRGQVVGFTFDGVNFDTPGLGFVWEHGVLSFIEPLPGDDTTFAILVSDHGEVLCASYASNASLFHYFVWREGVTTPLGSLGGDDTFATDMNSKGQVVGTSRTATGERHPFLWEKGVMTDLYAITRIGSSQSATMSEE